MGYDAGALLPGEIEYLKSADAPIPSGFSVLGPKPQTAVVTKGGRKVGIVFFPPPPDMTKPTPPDLGDAVAEAAGQLRPSVALVIGVSGIGMMDEEAFLKAHPDALDVLLGSGLNAGTAGRPGPGGKTLWARAYTRGKTVNRLDLMRLPDGPDFTWKPGETFKAEVINLDDAYPADPEIKKLFE
jgi:2',3'-cyclic-nucleotide 2'-phosphodiesterase (5'-nucleotidase family)